MVNGVGSMTGRTTPTGTGVATLLALAVAVLSAGCSHTTAGTPVGEGASGTEPSFPTPRPSVSTPTSTTPSTTASSPAPTSGAPPGTEALSPQGGYVFIQTKSGQTRCQLSTAEVDCEAQFTNSPVIDGIHAPGVQVTTDGDLKWVVGNLGDIPAVTLDYRKYSAVGWTIDASADGTRFTNDSTGHGMFVAIERVEAF